MVGVEPLSVLPMYELYSLNSKFDKTQTCGSFVGVKTNKLFRLDIKKSVKDRYIHFTLKESFEYCDLLPNENPKDALFKRGRIYSESNSPKNEFVLRKISAEPGNYFPRIYRPILEQNSTVSLGRNQRIEQLEEIVYNYPVSIPYNTTILVSGVNQLVTLTSLLDEILNTVYPSSSNLKTFGHQIKNLLVLSCIEVEAQLKGIYKANEVSQKKNYFTTDYIKLKDPMQLDRYSVKLPLYPDLRSFEPFKKWNSKEPTKSLKWYDNYNAVKHNGETEFHRATLESAISSLCAIVILLKAQYGNSIPYWKEEIGSYFEVTENTSWSLNERILPPLENDTWKPNKLGL